MAEMNKEALEDKSMGIMGLLHWNTIFILGTLFFMLYVINFTTVELNTKNGLMELLLDE